MKSTRKKRNGLNILKRSAQKVKSYKTAIIWLVTIVIIFIITLIVGIPILVKHNKQKNNYEELCFLIDEFDVDFDDDNCRYDIFANGKHYYIPQKQLEIIIDTQYTYIELFINEYDDLYNKAYLHINIKNEVLENDG